MTLSLAPVRRPRLVSRALPAAAALMLLPAAMGLAQEKSEKPAPAPCGRAQFPVKVVHLANTAQTNEANEIMIAVRNMVQPEDKIYLLTLTNDIVVSGPPDQIASMEALIHQLDIPKQTFRLTYTVNESDSGKRIGVQHFSMVVVAGQRVTLKQGDKIPVITGSFSKDNVSQQTDFTYLDVGMNFDATIDPFANGLRLRSKVEQSSVAEPQSGAVGPLAQEPVVRQTVLEGTSVIFPGKPSYLGSIDLVGSTRHTDIEVVAEPIP